jgi:long-chain acyl-CoA synthetase
MSSTDAPGAQETLGGPRGYPWLKAYPAGVDWHMPLDPAPLYKLLDDAVANRPTQTCTNFFGKTTTYSEIGSLVDRATAGLQRIGVKKGTKVGLFLPNCPTFIIYYFAILKAGGIVVNYNPLYTVEELNFQVIDSETELMVTLDLKILFEKVESLIGSGALSGAVVASFSSLLPASKAVLFKLFKGREIARPLASPIRSKLVLEADLITEDDAYKKIAVDPVSDVAVLQYTGGTTGTPKGAMLTHANVYINVQQVVAWAPDLVYGEEKVLGVLPFFHVFAMTVVMNFGVAMAAEIIIMPRFVLGETLKLIDKLRPTIMPGVPTLFNAIMNFPKIKSYDLSSLKFCLSGGAALPIEVKQTFESVTGCVLVEGYGLSETSPVVSCNPLDGPTKPGSIGLPLPATIIALRDLGDPEKDVAKGERGEICIAGPQVMPGYWKKPAETASQFVGVYLRTGDVGVMDDEGSFFIVDRIKDLIICSGYNVYPRRIEEAIYEHPAVEEVTVIGVADKYRGEAPKAFIKLKSGMTLTADDVMSHLEPKLSKIELPEEIEFRDNLPKTMIGKLSKKELKAEEDQRRET